MIFSSVAVAAGRDPTRGDYHYCLCFNWRLDSV